MLNWLLIQKQNYVRFPSSYIAPTAFDEVLKLKDPNFCPTLLFRDIRTWKRLNICQFDFAWWIEQFVDIVAKEIKI